MPKIKSAKKRLRQSRAHELRNRGQRSELRTALRKVKSAGSAKEATEAYAAAERLLDRAARKGLVHPNNAARHKSRLKKAITTKA